MVHCPNRYDYGMRYAREDLPASVHARLAELLYVKDPQDLDKKRKDAATFFAETLSILES